MSNVDTSIHPHATCQAAALAARHAADQPLKLYSGWFCPFVQRAWIVLQEKRIPYQYIEVNPYRKEPSFLALNPRGLVPTLAVPVDPNGTGKELKPLYESIVVCEYLDEAYNDATIYGQPLLPESAYERARCRLWIDFIASRLVPAFYKLLQHTPEKTYTLDEARAELHGHLKTFVKEMAGEEVGPWFLGERFSLVDVAFAPWAMRLWLIDYYKPGGVGIPLEGEGDGGLTDDEGVWKRWRVWFDAISKRESVHETLSEKEKYVGVYKRYAEDTTNSLVGQATRRGQRLP